MDPLLWKMPELQRRIVEILAGGRTRSSLELVTELRVAYDDVAHALTGLCEESVIREAYRETHDGVDEIFYELVSPLPATVVASARI